MTTDKAFQEWIDAQPVITWYRDGAEARKKFVEFGDFVKDKYYEFKSKITIDELMESLDGKLKHRVVYSMEKIELDFGIDTGGLKGTLTQFEWGIQYSRKELKAYKFKG